jgi:uncharacterized protein (DUF2141 family)
MRALRLFAAVALAASVLAVPLVQARQQTRDQMQTPRAAPGIAKSGLSGVIMTDEATPQPIKRAQVTIVSPESSFSKSVVTNDAGRFAFTGLPAGRYTLSANKPAFLRTAYGAKRWDRPGTPITLKEGHQMTDIVLRLPRGGVLSGVITDENGAPAFGVGVRVMQMRMQNGERTFTQVLASGQFGETTDDRGMYRLYGLPPGEYAVTATPRVMAGEIRAMTENEIRAVMQALQQQQVAAQQAAQRPGMPGASATTPLAPKPEVDTVMVGYASVYYPGTTSASTAQTVMVAAGEERSGVDFALKLVRTAKVEGTVALPAGIRPQSVQLMLAPATTGNSGLELLVANRTSPDENGKFTFAAVQPGQYVISARAGASAAGMPPPPPPPPPPPGGGGVMQFETIRVAPAGVAAGEPMFMMADALGGQGGGPTYWGQADVAVDGTPVSGVSVSLQPGMTVSGRVTFKGARAAAGADFSRVRLTLIPAPTGGAARISMGVPMAQVDASGQFKITGVTPGRYRISGVAPLAPGSGPGPGWVLSSVVARGRDLLDFPVEIGPNEEIIDVTATFTDATQEVSGTLQDATGRAAPDYTIVVFAAENQYWTTPSRRIRNTRPGTDGRFSLANLPPGEYRIAALVDVAPGEINDPAFLEQLVAASVKFTLAEGEKRTQDLRIAGGL